jgi:hypothetical protein
MTIRIAASILAIFAAAGLITPFETFARGSAFAGGGRTAAFHRGFRAPMIRPAFAPPRPVVSPAPMIRPAFAPPRPVVAPAPMIRPAFAPLQRTAAPAHSRAAAFAHFRHRPAPVIVLWGSTPWYGDYETPWYETPLYSGYGAPLYSSYDDSTYAAPVGKSSSDTNLTMEPNAMPQRLGCSVQIYKVLSEDGGERAVKVVRC